MTSQLGGLGAGRRFWRRGSGLRSVGHCLLLVALAGSSRGGESAPGATITIDDIAAGIRGHIAKKSQADGGYFKLQHARRTLQLELVRVHMEYLAHLNRDVSFACVDMVGKDGPVYDVDFFLKGKPGNMRVTQTSVHKINGHPLYAWEQKSNGSWHKVAVRDASDRLLGVINGEDDFEFTYRLKLPNLAEPARLWLPLATSDNYQTVVVKSIQTPSAPRELEEREHGDKVLFLNASPADSGKTIEVVYQVRRREKSPYAATEPEFERYLRSDHLVPVNDQFRETAARVTYGLTNDLERARAIYDHVMDTVRYAKYGEGWGRGDAVYACSVKSGNCSDFHAYFIALARAAGIPARFAVGAAIPAERSDGGIDGYHCWVEFCAEGKWYPVDVSEANKCASLATYYFGHHPANRFELSRGRDLVVEPGPASGPINFLAYPLVEVGGKPVKVQTEFLFRRLSVPPARASS